MFNVAHITLPAFSALLAVPPSFKTAGGDLGIRVPEGLDAVPTTLLFMITVVLALWLSFVIVRSILLGIISFDGCSERESICCIKGLTITLGRP